MYRVLSFGTCTTLLSADLCFGLWITCRVQHHVTHWFEFYKRSQHVTILEQKSPENSSWIRKSFYVWDGCTQNTRRLSWIVSIECIHACCTYLSTTIVFDVTNIDFFFFCKRTWVHYKINERNWGDHVVRKLKKITESNDTFLTCKCFENLYVLSKCNKFFTSSLGVFHMWSENSYYRFVIYTNLINETYI